MFHRSLLRRFVLILAALFLAVSAGTAWAASLFIDMSATNGNLQAWPTGISQTEGVILNGYNGSNYFTPYAFPAGTAGGTLTNINSHFTDPAGTMTRCVSTCMSDNGNATANEALASPRYAWSVTGNTGNLASASYAYFQYPGNMSTRSNVINDNGDVGGMYNGGKYSSGAGMNAFIYTGGTSHFLDVSSSRASGGGDLVTAINDYGQAVGLNLAGPVQNFDFATLWSYTTSGGTFSYTATDLLTVCPALNTALSNLYPGVQNVNVAPLAINSSGAVVLGTNGTGIADWSPGAAAPANYLLYDESTNQITSLGSLQMWDPLSPSYSWCGGHEQAINDSGQVVGYTGVQSSGTWRAAIWESGTITDLNTRYTSILPSGVVLNEATAIDNNGDIAGFCTDVASHTVQAFEILNVVPEPGTLALWLTGLTGLLAYAWRKRK